MKINTVLFDFDGVITDTEPQYEVYFNELADRYKLNIPDFAARIRGVTLPDMLNIYFNDYSRQEKDKIVEETRLFEEQMDFEFVAGVQAFISYLKDNSYKIGLVTSSPETKMKIALDKLGLQNTFDAVVTANQIMKGKPDPMCYLLAAEILKAQPSQCVVFEDSLAGIASAKNANMKVVGLYTTLSEEELRGHVDDMIPNFAELAQVTAYLD